VLETQLPRELSILGIAEHTAAIVDLDARTLEVRGRGFVAIRQRGSERRFEAGQLVSLEALALADISHDRASANTRPQVPDRGDTIDRVSDDDRLRLELRQAISQIVEVALRLRDEARHNRRYSEADRLRDALGELGIEIRDTPVGSEWTMNEPGL
jgi:cyanophycinase-like exopeptidase